LLFHKSNFTLQKKIMIIYPNSKINLGLFVTSKRIDGYHNIETVFYPTTLCDALEIVKSDKVFELKVSGNNVAHLEIDNICEKAYLMLKNRYDLPPVKIHLLKNIPVGSGLGGGSSDAVYTLKLLNEIFNLNMNSTDFYFFARSLGSDCAFFVENTPKFAFEKGDVFEDIQLSLKGLWLAVVVPPVAVNTADAYKNVNMALQRECLKNIIKLPIQEWKFELYNDFEFSIFKKHTQIKVIKEKLYKIGAVYASMSGSGSAVYGIFNKEPRLPNFQDCFVWKEKL